MEDFSHYRPRSSQSPIHETKKYDVFLSFRGPDVRKSFVDHLYRSLSAAGLNVFIDSEKLEKGENIGMSLQQGIQNSTIYIPIFSPDYASSVWCLREVSLMSNLNSSNAHILIPLFYNVEPSHVRYADGPYAEAFNKHQEKNRYAPDVIQGWREVLRQVSCLSGWSLKETACGYEGKLVSQVVKDVLQSLDFRMLEVAQHSVGLEPRSHELRQLLKLGDETCDKLSLGIWGMPGLGKTNLSKALYNEIRHFFQASSFVSNVNREGGITKLQRQILNDLLRTDMKLNDVDHGKIVMRSRLASIKALVVLDDVANEWQLDALQGDWFGTGSRIIITTQDSRVLELRQVDVIYPMRKLEHGEAVELFSRHAFHTAHPKRDYEDMTERIVKICSGLPLSLKIIGTDLYNRDNTRCWAEVLKKLENVGNDVVFETLKICYNNLSRVEKHIFLDIACFFVDIKSSDLIQNRAFTKDFFTRFWNILGCESVSESLERLKEKSFIVIDERQRYNEAMDDGLDEEDQYLWEFSMHDQIRDMGRRIVREESWNDPTQRSRVWREEDIRTLMAATTIQGNENVEGLMWRRHMEIQSIETLASLQKLGFLLWWELQVENEIKTLPTNLKYLVLSECRLEMAKTESGCEQILNFIWRWISQAKVKIKRTLSKQYDPQMMTGNSSSRGVNEFPVFSHVLPKSIAQLVYLKYLDMSGTEQSCLPTEICTLHSLEELYLSRCGLKALPEAFGSLINLRSLDVSDNFLSQFPLSFDRLESLVKLEMARNKELVVFASLPVNLIVLNARACSKLETISLNCKLYSLKTIDLSYCESLTRLSRLFFCKSLRDVIVEGCEELDKLDPLPPSVTYLRTSGCPKLHKMSFKNDAHGATTVDQGGPKNDAQVATPFTDGGPIFGTWKDGDLLGEGGAVEQGATPHFMGKVEQLSKVPRPILKELQMIGCDNIALNMFHLLKVFPHLEQLDLSLSSEVADELTPLIGEKNVILHSLSYDSCVVAFFCFVTESEENALLPQMDVLMTYLEDVSGSLISKSFEVPSCMKRDKRGRVTMRVCIWHIKSRGMARGMASCSYSVRYPSAQFGSQAFLRQVEFFVLKENATSQDAIQFLKQWKLLSFCSDIDSQSF